MCEYINKHFVPSEPLLDWLVDQRWLRFPNHRHVLAFDKGITSLGELCDGQDPSFSLAYDRSVYCYCFLNVKYILLRL